MEDLKRFLSALRSALSGIERDRKGLYRSAETRPLHLRLKAHYAQHLRVAAAAKITELDVDVMEDLMKVVKKLGKDSMGTGNRLETRLKLTLDLIDHVISRTIPTTPDHLLWLFNKIYQGLTAIIPDVPLQPVTQEVAS
jgi:hypothetical protein